MPVFTICKSFYTTKMKINTEIQFLLSSFFQATLQAKFLYLLCEESFLYDLQLLVHVKPEEKSEGEKQ